jgi:hypothetical protein
MNAADPLAQLRDIHLPPPVGWWPPAPGWWLLALLLIALLLSAILRWRRWRRRTAYRRAALAELRRLETGDIVAINALLKRTALAAGCRDAGALSGAAWLQFLEQTRGGDAPLLQPAERDALLSLYAAQPIAIDGARLRLIAERWIRRHRC